MYARLFTPPDPSQSYFLFGPRATGKSSWLKSSYPTDNYIDLLDADKLLSLRANPKRLLDFCGNLKLPILIDEVQKVPELLNEVHRLIENKKLTFVLTGSSARSLRKKGVNLLAGRALTYHFHPLTAHETSKDFEAKKAIRSGLLPIAIEAKDPQKYLQSYLKTYLTEEVQQEALTRNLPAFSRFLESASFSQAAPLNVSSVAADCFVERKVVENYFSILKDLLLAFEVPIFNKRAKRELIKKSKFFFFDCGVFRTIRPKGPLDSEAEINGMAAETLVVQNLRAINDYLELGYGIYYWHTRKHQEVDVVLYGQRGIIAIEVKSGNRLRDSDFDNLLLFKKDYPMAKLMLIHGGREHQTLKSSDGGVEVIGMQDFLLDPMQWI